MSDPFPIRELQQQFPLTAGWLNRTKKTLDATEETVGNNVEEITALNETSENLLAAQTNLETRADATEASLADHIADTTDVHGASGKTLGNTDTATEAVKGPVLRMTARADAGAITAIAIAGTAGAAYTATEQGLLNTALAQINALVADVTALRAQINGMLADERTAGQRTT